MGEIDFEWCKNEKNGLGGEKILFGEVGNIVGLCTVLLLNDLSHAEGIGCVS